MDRKSPSLTRHIKTIWPDDTDGLTALVTAGEEVTRLANHPGWRAIIRVLDAELAALEDSLDNGPAKEQADYAKLHGRKSALSAVEDAATAIVREAKNRQAAAARRLQAEGVK